MCVCVYCVYLMYICMYISCIFVANNAPGTWYWTQRSRYRAFSVFHICVCMYIVYTSYVFVFMCVFVYIVCTSCIYVAISFRQRATTYRAFLQKMTYEDKASYDSSPPCTAICIWSVIRSHIFSVSYNIYHIYSASYNIIYIINTVCHTYIVSHTTYIICMVSHTTIWHISYM